MPADACSDASEGTVCIDSKPAVEQTNSLSGRGPKIG